ncbi:MAG: hypothetical protein WBN66_09890 [Smithella sp.]
MMKKTLCLAMALLVSVFFLTSCSGGKNAADVAIKAAEEAVNVTKAEAVKIVPDEVKSLEDTLAAAKDKFSKGEYKAAMEEATALAGKAKEVMAAAKAKKEELTGKWMEMSQELPKMFEGIKAKVEELAKAKKLPANLTKEKFEEAKAGLASVQEEWGKAQQSFVSGNMTEALTGANSLKDKGLKIMESLGMSAPAATPAADAAATPAAPAPAAK